MKKQSLRKQLKAERLKLSREEIDLKSRHIVERLKALLDWEQVKTLHCFTSLGELNEVETKDFFEFIWRHHPHIQTFTTLPLDGKWALGKAERGVFAESKSAMQRYDVIIVPMLGFDDSLRRIGYGAGYYDQFLASQPNAKKIGVCFELGREDELPHEPHDVQMDNIITEAGLVTSPFDPTPRS